MNPVSLVSILKLLMSRGKTLETRLDQKIILVYLLKKDKQSMRYGLS